MATINLRYLVSETDRHGRVRQYVRRLGKRIAINHLAGSPAFFAAYNAALEEIARTRTFAPLHPAPETPAEPAAKGSTAEAADAYFNSTRFRGLNAKYRKVRQQIIERCLREPIAASEPGLGVMGSVPLADFGTKHLRVLRDRKADKPGAARNRMKYFSAMFAWLVANDMASLNPCRDVESIKYATEGFHTWTREEVAQFEERHPIGTKARLALALLLFTGVRRGDVVTLGRQHIKAGWLRYVPQKTSYKHLEASEKPVLPVLAEVIRQSPTGDMTFLVTHRGVPFTANGFGGWFRERCDEAGLRHCSAHGLKKAGATIAAENGATVPQLQALFNWRTIGQAQVYIEKANRKRLANDAMHLIDLSNLGTDTPERFDAGSRTK